MDAEWNESRKEKVDKAILQAEEFIVYLKVSKMIFSQMFGVTGEDSVKDREMIIELAQWLWFKLKEE